MTMPMLRFGSTKSRDALFADKFADPSMRKRDPLFGHPASSSPNLVAYLLHVRGISF